MRTSRLIHFIACTILLTLLIFTSMAQCESDPSLDLHFDNEISALRLDNKHTESYSAPMDLRNHSTLSISFELNTSEFEEYDLLYVEYSTDNGITFSEISLYEYGVDFVNNTGLIDTLILNGPFSSETIIKFGFFSEIGTATAAVFGYNILSCEIKNENSGAILSTDEGISAEQIVGSYPNPSNGSHIHLSSDFDFVHIYDSQGMWVTEVRHYQKDQTIYLNLPEGVYFIHADELREQFVVIN